MLFGVGWVGGGGVWVEGSPFFFVVMATVHTLSRSEPGWTVSSGLTAVAL